MDIRHRRINWYGALMHPENEPIWFVLGLSFGTALVAIAIAWLR